MLRFSLITLAPLILVVGIIYFVDMPTGLAVTILLVYLAWFTWYAIVTNWGQRKNE
jgi:hypothetical protein